MAGIEKLDQPRHQYDLLWPIGEFDFDDDEHRFFPFFWGEFQGPKPRPYFVTFPFVWWEKDQYFTLFPALWYAPKEYFVIFPVVWYYPKDEFSIFPIFWYEKKDHFALFPLFMNFKETDSTHVLWPLFHLRQDAKPSWHVGPLAGDWKLRNGRYSYLLWPLGHRYREGDKGGEMFLPLYAHEFHKDWDRYMTPLYISYKNAAKGESGRFIAPSWIEYSKGEDRVRTLLPLYFGQKKGDTNFWLTPLAGKRTEPRSKTWIASPLLSAYTKAESHNEVWALAPLTRFQWGPLPNKSHAFPFYLYNGEKNVFLSPLYANHSNSDGSRTQVVPPLLYSRRKGKDLTRTWSPWPLVMNEWSAKDGRKSAALPLYLYNGEEKIFLSLPYSKWQAHKTDFSALFGPLYVHKKAPNETRGYFVWPFTSLAKTKHGWEGWFTLFIHDKTARGYESWYPWPIARSFKIPREHGSWLFPLWSYKKKTIKPRKYPPAEISSSVEIPDPVPEIPDEQEREMAERAREIGYVPVGDPAGSNVQPIYVKDAEQLAEVEDPADQKTQYKTSFRLLLLWLYAYDHETKADRTRSRVLGHLVDYKREGATKSVDVFPAISYDSDKETGFRKFSFLWRLYRYQRDANGGKKLDVLFIPVVRKN